MPAELDFMRLSTARVGTSARALLTQLRGHGAEGDDDDAEGFDDAEVAQPYGLMANPKRSAGLEAIVWRDGDEAVVIAIVDKTMPASTLAEGETMLYGGQSPSATVHIKASGEVVVTSKSGEKIKLNASEATATSPVAHEGSVTTGHQHVEMGVGLRAGWLPVVGTSALQTDSIAVGAGSANVLVPDT